MKLGPVNIVREHRMASLAYPSMQMFDSFGATPTWAGEKVTPQKMIQEAAVYSAVRQISEAVGRSPLSVYRRLDDDTREEARTHRSWRLLHDKPNSETTAHAFWAAVAVQLLVYENAYLLKAAEDPVAGVDTLWILDAASVRIDWVNGAKRFVIEGPPRRVFTSEDVLHIPGFSYEGLAGVTRAELCRQTLATALARAKFEGMFYSRGAKLSGVIHHPGRLGDKGTQRLSEQFKQWHSGQHHGVPVLEEGAQFAAQSMSMEDMQFVELRQLSLAEIAIMFQMPPAYLGASTGDSLTYATTESNQIQFVSQAVDPLAHRIDTAVSQDPELLPQNIMYARFNTDVLYVPDAKSRAERWQILHGLGVVDEAFIAAKENLPKPPPKPKPVVQAPPADENGSSSMEPAKMMQQLARP